MKNKTLISFLLSLVFVLASCVASGPKADIVYKFSGKRGIAAGVDRYTFNYSIDNGKMHNLDIYVYEDRDNFLISPEYTKKQAISLYEYNTTEAKKNFVSRHRMSTDQVENLSEAIQKAMLWYVEDFKLEAIQKEADPDAEK